MVNEFEDRILFAEGDDQDDDDTLETEDEETEDDKDEDESDKDESDDSEDDDDSDDSKDEEDAGEEGDEKKEKKETEKKPETPEAKRARLQRQLKQHEKKHGFTSDSSHKKDDKKEEQGTLTYRDTIALTNAKVHADDVDEVVEYARFKKISIAEALESNVIKNSLSEKAEQRKTADATNTGRARPGNARASGDKLLEKAKSTGELPASDADINSLVDARMKGKKKSR